MSIVRKIKRAVRGEVAVTTAALEVLRRGGATIARNRERANVKEIERRGARLTKPYSDLSPTQLLEHFRTRTAPTFFPDLNTVAELQSRHFPEQTRQLIHEAEKIANEHRWPLSGLGEQDFGAKIDWHLDPRSGLIWPLDYHSDINLVRNDGSDVRLVWELNRLPQLLTLARAFAVTREEGFSEAFFSQIDSWREQNPYGYGVNWSCAMEVALRTVNLFGAFEVFRQSERINEERLAKLLTMFDQHGAYIRLNLEFSYIATSNHYLSDVVGLVWLGILLPELQSAVEWREMGLRELLREMQKQVLPDGADFEASTGYHRLVTELFLYTFVLCRVNRIEIEPRYWERVRDMIGYLNAYLRPDGYAPLIGDSDSGQFLPICRRGGDDHAYLAALGAVVFNDGTLLPRSFMPEELPWVLGAEGVESFDKLMPERQPARSRAFRNAGTYILGDGEHCLLLNVSGAGIHGRGSHGHNDALSIEVAAYDTAFIVDPGTYIYTGDLKARQVFRSTAYHSTIEVDGAEQNTTPPDFPFIIGNEAKPRLLNWETGKDFDRVSAEHVGYQRLPHPVTHRRTVTFQTNERRWLVEDELLGPGAHDVAVRFHFNSGLKVNVVSRELSGSKNAVTAQDESGRSLTVHSLDVADNAKLEDQFTSRDYGAKQPSQTACWRLHVKLPCKLRWLIVPSSDA